MVQAKNKSNCQIKYPSVVVRAFSQWIVHCLIPKCEKSKKNHCDGLTILCKVIMNQSSTHPFTPPTLLITINILDDPKNELDWRYSFVSRQQFKPRSGPSGTLALVASGLSAFLLKASQTTSTK